MCNREYLSSSARDPINVDCKVAETAKRKVAEHADRYCFTEAEVASSLCLSVCLSVYVPLCMCVVIRFDSESKSIILTYGVIIISVY